MPQRAPVHLRQHELDAIDAALARRLVANEPLDREDLAAWLRHRGRSLASLLTRAGLDPTALVMRAMDAPAGVGGPFIAMPTEREVELDVEAVVARVLDTVPLMSPVRDAHRITSGFGKRRDPFRGRAAFHRGIDLAATRGTPIYAPAAGEVMRAGRLGGFGNVIEIDHGNGVLTRYAHLHAYHVKRGAWVEPGTRIGLMGRSGRTTGVHLHYEVMVDGRHVNPARFLEAGRQLVASRD